MIDAYLAIPYMKGALTMKKFVKDFGKGAILGVALYTSIGLTVGALDLVSAKIYRMTNSGYNKILDEYGYGNFKIDIKRLGCSIIAWPKMLATSVKVAMDFYENTRG